MYFCSVGVNGRISISAFLPTVRFFLFLLYFQFCESFLCPLWHFFWLDFPKHIISFPSATLTCGKASAKHRLPSAACCTVSTVCQYKLIGSVLIFISFRLGVDNHHLADDIRAVIIGNTVGNSKRCFIKAVLFLLRFYKLDLCLYSVCKHLHRFQIIVRTNSFRTPRGRQGIVIRTVTDHKGIFFRLIYPKQHFLFADINALLNLIRACHSFFLTHSHPPVAVFLSSCLKSSAYIHRRK
ncbi:hypothetical protein MGAS2096_Spy1153 [Streptococcus pyogenes MGAS2096]|uniref:Uncharacterized protein n=1 Tax=[Ruminococcus] torques ATCC 27756 TaxID=411460 RepID=A5KN78_9FIRM|nr:hypothetical protein MGAS2096_Spy1153 [Streptococcus pyogenes MGAS2096]EDK24030.1 hypothetical protein RUMTOR_01705 [[Ruminococcus] torques ATCC 27756]